MQGNGLTRNASAPHLLSRFEPVLRDETFVLFSSAGTSYLAIGAASEVVVREDSISISGERFGNRILPTSDPFATIGELVAEHPHCTLFGYIAFDACRFYHRYTKRASHPVIHLVEPKVVLTLDAKEANAMRFGDGAEELASMALAALRSPGASSPASGAARAHAFPHRSDDGTDREQYMSNVERAVARVRGGDPLKVILSRSVEAPGRLDLLRTHAAATAAAAFDRSFAFRLGSVEGVGVSPAPLLRASASGSIETVALAGSRPRGSTVEDDDRLSAELFRDPKEASEHALSAWLALEEIGSVSRAGSAAIRKFMDVRKLKHIQHLGAHVTGDLAPGLHTGHALRALFPGVTSTGLPKSRAIETIDALEPSSRGVYGGAVGWWSGSGAADFAISLRSAFGYKGSVRISAGAGIVSSSQPDYEWQETTNKMNTILTQTLLVSEP